MIIVTGGAGFIGNNIVDAPNGRSVTDLLIVDRIGGFFAKDFDSQSDSQGLGQRRMKGTAAEVGTRDLASFVRGRTRFNRT